MSGEAKNQIILEVIYSFDIGGSERLAAAIAQSAHKIGKSVGVVAINGTNGPIRDQLEQNGIPCYGINGGNVSRFTVLFNLFKLFRKLKPTVLHMHHVTQLIACFWPAKLVGVPKLVLTEHANYSIRIIPKLNKRAKFYCPKVDVVTTVHDGLKKYFHEELNVPSNIQITIPNGVDTTRFAPKKRNLTLRNSLSIQENAMVLGCIGRLVEAKDHENLLQSIYLLVKQGVTNIVVLVIGGGPLLERIENKIEELKLGDFVHCIGERSDIEELLHQCDVVVMSSKREGFPMVLLEAMSSGIPCISTNVGAVPQLISEGSGIVVPPEDSEALAAAIKEIYLNREKLPQMGKCAREIVTTNYGIEEVLSKYLQVLNH